MNSSISSIQSDNKPTKKPGYEPKRNNKLQEEIENHVKSQTKKVERELAGEWNELLEQCLNEEISQAEEILIEEIESFIGKSLQENYYKTKETTINTIDETFRSKGYLITPTQIQINYTPELSFAHRGRTKKSIERIHVESDDIYFDNTSTETNDLRLEVVKYIEKSIENLAGKFEKMSLDIISNEITQRIQRMKIMICSEVQDFLAETKNVIKSNLEQVVQERTKEILSFNQEKIDVIPKEYPPRFLQPEQSHKPKYEENYEFIESLANNYSSLKNNSTDPQNTSGSFTREHKYVPKKNPGKNEKIPIPRTDVSAVLQQFLKK